MAFVTGTANSFTDLLTALQNACTANGYALTGNVLSKGTLFAEVTYVTGTYPRLKVRGGSGQASGVLSGASDRGMATLGHGTTGSALGDTAFTFPMTYNIHIGTAPDEVYLFVNYNLTMYQFIAFGQSNVPGIVGTGNWYAGSDIDRNGTPTGVDARTIGGYMEAGYINGGLFQGLQGYPASMNGAVDHQLDSATWLVRGAWGDLWAAMPNNPSSWNDESVLLPVTVYANRPSGFISCVAELAHARFVAIDNFTDRQVITLGSDKWMVYPWWQRGPRAMPPGSTTTTTTTGTVGHAVRYDGP